MLNRTFFQQLFYTILLLMGLTLILYFSVTVGVVKRSLNRESRERQMSQTRMAANMLSGIRPEGGGFYQEFADKLAEGTTVRVTLIDEEGLVLADTSRDRESMSDHSDRPEIRQALFRGTGSATRFSSSVSITMLYTAVYLPEQNLVVRLSRSVEQVRQDLDRIYIRILLIFLVVLLLGSLFAVIIARRQSGTLTAVRDVAGQFAKGNFDVELDVTGSREAVSLTRSINTMGRQLQDKISTITYQKNELRGMLNSMREPVILLNHRLEIKKMNPAAVAMLEPGDGFNYIGKGILQIMRSVEVCDLAEDTLRSGKHREALVYFREKELYLQVYGSCLFRDEEIPPSVLLVMNDITRIKKLEEMRKDFVANVSHELRTPVTSIMGYVETLKAGALDHPEKAREFVEIMSRQTRNLNALIDDLLTLSRIEDGRRRFHRETFPLNDLLASAVSICLHKAKEKGTRIRTECDGELEVSAHPVLLEQAVANLIENAVKYSPGGTAVFVRGGMGDDSIFIEVRDEGPGIPAADRDRIFERFYRVDKARSREMGGTGLGLAIVKHIALIHGGSVGVESREGEGCLFTITLPAGDQGVTGT